MALQAGPPRVEISLRDSERDVRCAQNPTREGGARGDLTSGSFARHRGFFAGDQQEQLPLRHHEHTAELALLQFLQSDNLLVEVACSGQVLYKESCFKQTVNYRHRLWHGCSLRIGRCMAD